MVMSSISRLLLTRNYPRQNISNRLHVMFNHEMAHHPRTSS